MSCRAALDVRIMRIMRIMRLCDWCADCNNHPCGTSAPRAKPNCAPRNPPGYHMACRGAARQGEDGRTLLSDRSDRSDASATPTQTAYRRCHKTSLAYPNGKFAPSQTKLRPSQTIGVSHGLPRRSPSGRRRARPLVRQVRQVSQVRCTRRSLAQRIPPLPSRCLNGIFSCVTFDFQQLKVYIIQLIFYNF